MLMEIVTGTLAIGGTGFVVSALLSQAKARLDADEATLVDAINSKLPQTQCAQCGYPGCRPYAEAIANQNEAINRCPPGGDHTIAVLADLLGREPLPLDPDCGEAKGPVKAVVREADCIGCTLCIQACPVDAIVGAPQVMHTVIESECTGCELCLPPCPVDCIELVELPVTSQPEITSSSALECIRCGLCETACPRDLEPQDLYWFREDDDAMAELELSRCIECRRCDRVCPSAIPLTAHFREAKQRVAQREAEKTQAAHAEARYDARERRIAVSRSRVRARPSREEKSALLDAIKQQVQ